MVTDKLGLVNAQLGLDCPKCGAKNGFTLGQVSVGESIICVGCGVTIKLKDDGSVGRAQQAIDNSLNDLQLAISSVNDRLGRG